MNEKLPKGIFLDDAGDRVTKHGYLVDHQGNIIDKKGNKVFDKKLMIDGNVPLVFQAIKGANKERRQQVIIIPRQRKKDEDPLNSSLRKSIEHVISQLSEEDKRLLSADSRKSDIIPPRDPCFQS